MWDCVPVTTKLISTIYWYVPRILTCSVSKCFHYDRTTVSHGITSFSKIHLWISILTWLQQSERMSIDIDRRMQSQWKDFSSNMKNIYWCTTSLTVTLISYLFLCCDHTLCHTLTLAEWLTLSSHVRGLLTSWFSNTGHYQMLCHQFMNLQAYYNHIISLLFTFSDISSGRRLYVRTTYCRSYIFAIQKCLSLFNFWKYIVARKSMAGTKKDRKWLNSATHFSNSSPLFQMHLLNICS
jgi:hypothetical protein